MCFTDASGRGYFAQISRTEGLSRKPSTFLDSLKSTKPSVRPGDDERSIPYIRNHPHSASAVCHSVDSPAKALFCSSFTGARTVSHSVDSASFCLQPKPSSAPPSLGEGRQPQCGQSTHSPLLLLLPWANELVHCAGQRRTAQEDSVGRLNLPAGWGSLCQW